MLDSQLASPLAGICISGGVSGGHLNPAVTLTMAALRKIKLIQV